MSFFKKLFESRPLSMSDLLKLHSSDGMYKGEILNELKNVVLFIALPEGSTGPVNFDDPSTQYLILNAPENRGFLVPVFMDHMTLTARSEKLVPHMIEFKTLAKIMENKFCLGILFCSGVIVDMVYTRKELSRVLPSIKS